jgi:hypothetical protein
MQDFDRVTIDDGKLWQLQTQRWRKEELKVTRTRVDKGIERPGKRPESSFHLLVARCIVSRFFLCQLILRGRMQERRYD